MGRDVEGRGREKGEFMALDDGAESAGAKKCGGRKRVNHTLKNTLGSFSEKLYGSFQALPIAFGLSHLVKNQIMHHNSVQIKRTPGPPFTHLGKTNLLEY